MRVGYVCGPASGGGEDLCRHIFGMLPGATLDEQQQIVVRRLEQSSEGFTTATWPAQACLLQRIREKIHGPLSYLHRGCPPGGSFARWKSSAVRVRRYRSGQAGVDEIGADDQRPVPGYDSFVAGH